jgi:hypothetical protein
MIAKCETKLILVDCLWMSIRKYFQLYVDKKHKLGKDKLYRVLRSSCLAGNPPVMYFPQICPSWIRQTYLHVCASIRTCKKSLPETESSPWAWRFAESQRSSSRRRPSTPRALGPALGEGLAHGAEHLRRERSGFHSRRRAQLTAPLRHQTVPVRQIRRESGIHGSQRRNTHGATNTFAESKPWVHGHYSRWSFQKKNFTFSSPNFFLPPHTLIQRTCSKLASFCLCLLYLTIPLLYTYFFLYVWYELQVHKILEQICS